MAELTPKQPLKKRKVSKGVYETTDTLFRIEKVEGNRWSWFINDGGVWVAIDKRKYPTLNWCEMCVEAYNERLNAELQLWEG
jgi:hypothetical protein